MQQQLRFVPCSRTHSGGKQGCLQVRSGRSWGHRHASQPQHSLDVVGKFPVPLADRPLATTPQQVHHHCAQEGKRRCAVPIGVAVRVLTQLSVPRPVPLFFDTPALPDQAKQRFWPRPQHRDEGQRPHGARPSAGEGAGGHLDDQAAARPVLLDAMAGWRRSIPRLFASGGYSVWGIRLGRGRFSRWAFISSMRKAMASRPCCSRLVVTVMSLPTNCPPQLD